MMCRFLELVARSACALVLSTETVGAASFTFDGVFTSGDMYTTDTQAHWFNDHKGTQFGPNSTAYQSGQQTLRVRHGQGTEAGGDGTEFYWLLIAMPLGAKNMVWSDDRNDLGPDLLNYHQQWSTHHCDQTLTPDCAPTKKKGSEFFEMTFNKAFGSEKLRFGTCAIGATNAVNKTSVSGCDYEINPSGKKLSVKVKQPDGKWLREVKTSINWLVEDQMTCTLTSCDAVNTEFSYEMKFDLAARDYITGLFAGGNASVNTHLSPERGGSQISNSVSSVPVPASLPLLGAGLALVAVIARKRRKSA